MSASSPSTEAWRELKARRERLPDATCAALAQHWSAAGQLEHASVASFCRFSLQLLAIGAPPALVEDTHRAALDEIEHTRLCFSLASVYAARGIGPGALPGCERSSAASDLLSAAVGTVEEGCVGETLAALEAEAAAELATDPLVQRVLLRIHEDESRHAELAFRFVRYAIDVGGVEVRHAVRDAFEQTLRRFRGRSHGAGVADADLEAHGVLGPLRKNSVRERVLTEVVEPLVSGLLGGDPFGARVLPALRPA